MKKDLAAFTASPEYKALIAKRGRLIWPLFGLTVLAYVLFILAIAFIPQKLGTLIGDGSISIGIILGLGLILFNFVITLIYVYFANRDIEPLLTRVHKLMGEK